MADSLLNVLKTQKEDTNRVNTLNLLVRNYLLKGDDGLTMKYANDAIAGAAKLNYRFIGIIPFIVCFFCRRKI